MAKTNTDREAAPTVARIVQSQRKRAGLSQFQLGAKSGVHPATISALERGIRVSPETLDRLADVLGLDRAELAR